MLICVRFLLLSVSIIIDAFDFMRTTVALEDEADAGVDLGPDEINDVIVYILHYGRALYRGDVEVPGQENNQSQEVISAPEPTTFNNNIAITTHQNPAQPVVHSPHKEESLSSSDEDEMPVKAQPAPAKPVTHNPPPVQQPAQVKPANPQPPVVQQPAAAPAQSNPIPVLPPKPEPAPAAAGGGAVNKLWLHMTIPEFKAWIDANYRPTADFNENKLPPGFEKPPVKPVYKEGSTREEYKAYMVAKYEYETWENKVVLFNIKLKKKLEELDKSK
jgi:hypothetical protein